MIFREMFASFSLDRGLKAMTQTDMRLETPNENWHLAPDLYQQAENESSDEAFSCVQLFYQVNGVLWGK